MTEFETKALEALDAIQTLLEALVGDCEATKVLEKRRAAKAASQAAWRAKQAEKAANVDSTSVDSTSGKEKTKDEERDIPPTPPIEKEAEKRKEGEVVVEDARAREDFSAENVRRTAENLRQRRIADVAAYNGELGGNIDAEYFVDYYADDWPRNWQARLRNWIKENKRSGRIRPAAPKPKKVPTLSELIEAKVAELNLGGAR